MKVSNFIITLQAISKINLRRKCHVERSRNICFHNSNRPFGLRPSERCPSGRAQGDKKVFLGWLVIILFAACAEKAPVYVDKKNVLYINSSPEIKAVDSINVQNLIKANDELIDILNIITNKTNDQKTKKITKELISNHTVFNSELAYTAQDVGISVIPPTHDSKTSDAIVQNLKATPYDKFQVQAIAELQNRYKIMFDNLKYAQDETSNPVLKNTMVTHLAIMQKYIEIVFDSLNANDFTNMKQ